MRIGFAVEDSTTEAFLEGLRRAWCPEAQLVRGDYRGTRLTPRACSKLCTDLLEVKGCDALLLLTDADRQEWRDVVRELRGGVLQGWMTCVTVGAPDRNIECWLVADRHGAAQALGCAAEALTGDDPKGAFERCMGITTFERKREEIADFVTRSRHSQWLASESFEAFYDELRGLSQQLSCSIPNLRDSKRS